MNYTKIYTAVLKVYQDCDIHSFPFSCEDVISHYGYHLISYRQAAEQRKELYDICMLCSQDAFLDKNNHMILYNPHALSNRPRFSLMHELGHIILEHQGEDDEQEKEANMFAGMLLAPPMAVHYSRLREPDRISSAFEISYDAACCALNQYYRWYEYVLASKMSSQDKQMYRHFYDEEAKCFVWTRHTCNICHSTILNSPLKTCPSCPSKVYVSYTPTYIPSKNMLHTVQNHTLRRAEQRWLYDV